MTTLLLKLLLAHFLGDFVFQPYKWVKSKERKAVKSKFFWFHIGVHFLLMFLFTGFETSFIPVVIGIGISHFVIDLLKIKLQNRCSEIPLFFGDQALHLLAILTAVGLYFTWDWSDLLQLQDKWLVLILAFVLLTSVSGMMMKVLLSKWDLNHFEGEALEKAGWYIGVLERLFIFGFVFSGHWAGIGFLIAAKSIFRFNDLSKSKDRKLTEYVLIGTLLSYGLAMLIAFTCLQLWYYVQ
ncbi:DUF3307 domain-containing protein [Psychroflexus sediminis]|uniref:DUF3307 domain-containing protein n=1 Tax=Psychroflexus sediminis TaxID=470826 RepID=A0A1G7VG42_9FLAO|nr:DUF3307 domain-containing protein [Psychroflexus sediminis]SDG58538.1 Protein of unknown function [Psychroflexus sediminis]